MIGIILAGGNGSRMAQTSSLPKPVLPLAGKPVIVHIMDEMKRHRVKEIILVLSPNTHDVIVKMVSKYYKDFKVAIQPEPRGPGNALLCGLDAISNLFDPVVVACADSVFKIDELPTTDAVLIAPAPSKETFNQWCYVEFDPAWGSITEFIDKPVRLPKTRMVNIGVYTFRNAIKIKNSTKLLKDQTDSLEISHIINQYGIQDMVAERVQSWLDTGTPKNYLTARRKLFNTRYFNNTTISGGRVIKRSSDPMRMQDEYTWYMNAAKRIPNNIPTDIQFDPETKTLSMGYVPLNTLSDYFLFDLIRDPRQYSQLLLRILEEVDSEQKSFSLTKGDMEEMYINKLEDRLVFYSGGPNDLNKYWFEIKPEVVKMVRNLVPHPGLFHGDLNFTNILVTPGLRDYVVIDPRGWWQGTSKGMIFDLGDIRYDAAKMYHSVCGYDHIINDMMHIPFTPLQQVVRDQVFNVLRSKFSNLHLVTGLLFLSMIPLHHGNLERQEQMFSLAKYEFVSAGVKHADLH